MSTPRSSGSFALVAVIAGAVLFTVVEARTVAKFRATSNNDNDDKNPLIFAQVMWRHGDRAPNAFWKKDPFAKSFPQGAGQLTALGWEQQYALGTFLRSRYGDYLNLDTTGLSYADVYVRSTDVERAIASAQANLAAFFRPPASKSKTTTTADDGKKTSTWETPGSDLHKLWQPVPIHTVPEKFDYVMHQNECEQLDLQKKKFEQTPAIQELKKTPEVQALFRGLSHITGEPLESWTISKTFKSLADTLYAERVHGMMLPKVPSGFYDAIDDLWDRTWVMPYEDKDLAQLRGGCILDTLVQNMRNKLDRQTAVPPTDGKKSKAHEPYSSRKLVLFSGHDTSLLGLISAAGMLEQVGNKPPYASSIYFELYADGTVDISYKNDSSSVNAIRTVQPVSLLKAPLQDLENRWKDVRLSEAEIQKKCEVPAEAKERMLLEPEMADDDDYGED